MTDAATSSQAGAAAVLAANRRRQRLRRWIAIGSLPLVLVALLFVGKILSMYASAYQAISSYVVDDYAGSETAARGQEFLNWFEPYKAPFNVGTALAGSEQLPESRAKLEAALELARGLQVCGVRINLALVIERMGDAARAGKDGEQAAELYGEALTITAETPEECNSDEAQKQSSDPERDMGKTLDSLRDRLQQKQKQTPPPKQPEPEQQPSQEKLEGLREQLQQGTQERDQQQNDDNPGGSGTDKPW